MSKILKSDLFRNFMGGFLIGAAALFALQPDDAFASVGCGAPAAVESSMKSPVA